MDLFGANLAYEYCFRIHTCLVRCPGTQCKYKVFAQNYSGGASNQRSLLRRLSEDWGSEAWLETEHAWIRSLTKQSFHNSS